MQKANYEVNILVNGSPLKEYIHDRKIYVEGRKGSSFSVRIRNNSCSKILAIPTIDGLSVINGEKASYESPGYVLQPFSAFVVEGWRKSDKDVAEFYFSDIRESYSQKRGKGSNQGVIGVAIFKEKEQNEPVVYPLFSFDGTTRDPRPYDYCYTDNTAKECSFLSASEQVSQKIGTGWGETKRSEVIDVLFDHEKYPDSVFEIFYNTRSELEKMGVDFDRSPQYMSYPKSFPGMKYCEPPK